MKKNMGGFSLIELLVVVAIIGVLSVAGLSFYISYINTAKDQRVFVEGSEIQKAIETDILAARMGVTSGGLANNLKVDDTCQALLEKVVESLLEQGKKNPFNDAFLVQTSSPNAELQRGSIFLSCAIPSAKISEEDFYLQTCICTESNCLVEPAPPVKTKLDKTICYQL